MISHQLTLHVAVGTWRAMAYTATRVSDIYAFHIKQQDLNQQFVVIADDRDVARRGLILININYKGTPDAIRQKAHAIGEFISHELIDHDDDYAQAWSHHVIHKTSTTLYPLRSLAVFVAKNCADREMISAELDSALFCGKHTGWNSRHRDFPSLLAQWELVTTSPSTQHEQWRIEKDWNEDYYVVVGNGLMDYSEVEIVSVKSKRRWSWSISNFCEVLHYLTIGLITEEELSSPWRAQPELLRALSPGWLQGFQDDIAAAGDIDDSDSGDDDEAARELLVTGYNLDNDAVELPSVPVWV